MIVNAGLVRLRRAFFSNQPCGSCNFAMLAVAYWSPFYMLYGSCCFSFC